MIPHKDHRLWTERVDIGRAILLLTIIRVENGVAQTNVMIVSVLKRGQSVGRIHGKIMDFLVD